MLAIELLSAVVRKQVIFFNLCFFKLVRKQEEEAEDNGLEEDSGDSQVV